MSYDAIFFSKILSWFFRVLFCKIFRCYLNFHKSSYVDISLPLFLCLVLSFYCCLIFIPAHYLCFSLTHSHSLSVSLSLSLSLCLSFSSTLSFPGYRYIFSSILISISFTFTSLLSTALFYYTSSSLSPPIRSMSWQWIVTYTEPGNTSMPVRLIKESFSKLQW